MRTWIWCAGLLVLGASGCATSSRELELRAVEHEARASSMASMKDYEGAAQEQATARKLHRKAAERQVAEQYQ
jgi:hypothetical protein